MSCVGRSWFSIFSSIVLVTMVGFEAGALGAAETRSVRDLGAFDSVSLGTNGVLIITQGDREALEIEASPRDLPRFLTEVRGGTLHIGRAGAESAFFLRPPIFRLTLKTLAGLETHSSGRIEAKGLRASVLAIRISSSGNISIDSLACDSLDAQIVSSGSLSISGTVERQDIRLSSSGNYFAKDFASRVARVVVSSSGGATLRVSDTLAATVTSSGDARFYGNPQVSGNVTSSGRLVRLGD